MAELKPGHVYVDIDRNQDGGLSLSICNELCGQRFAGGKVSGGKNLESYQVDGEELIRIIRAFMKASNRGGVQHER